MLKAYRIATILAEPLLPLWLYARRLRGKEDASRLGERFGYASIKRPEGPLIWIHAASVGEATSVLLFIQKIRERAVHMHILVTTGTVTSAELMAQRLPKGVMHQYVPLDTIEATQRFLFHWNPQFSLFVESELWPNLIANADYYNSFMSIINGRMSERSFVSWQKRPHMIQALLKCFNAVFAQSEEDAKRFKTLGAKHAECVGNLKFDATLLPCDEGELLALKTATAGRPLWLAASTHPGEEKLIAETHKLMAAMRPNLLTIIVPRHPARGNDVANELRAYGQVAQRSKKETITAGTQFYLADTLGELGLFYRLSELVFMGGSLVAHGGQNPLEAARLSCAIVTGPHKHNFAAVYDGMEKSKAAVVVESAKALPAQISQLMSNANARDALGKNAKAFVEDNAGAADRLLEKFLPMFEAMKP